MWKMLAHHNYESLDTNRWRSSRDRSDQDPANQRISTTAMRFDNRYHWNHVKLSEILDFKKSRNVEKQRCPSCTVGCRIRSNRLQFDKRRGRYLRRDWHRLEHTLIQASVRIVLKIVPKNWTLIVKGSSNAGMRTSPLWIGNRYRHRCYFSHINRR